MDTTTEAYPGPTRHGRAVTALLGMAGGALAAMAFSACKDPPTGPSVYPAHCWEATLETSDIPEHATQVGNFPITCDAPGGDPFLPDIPTSPAYFIGVGCPSHEDPSANEAKHFLTKSFIPKHQAMQSYSTDESSSYGATVVYIGEAVFEECMDYLTCSGTPGNCKPGCDIDSDLGGNQCCTIATAETICETYVEAVLEAQLAIDGSGDIEQYRSARRSVTTRSIPRPTTGRRSSTRPTAVRTVASTTKG